MRIHLSHRSDYILELEEQRKWDDTPVLALWRSLLGMEIDIDDGQSSERKWTTTTTCLIHGHDR